MSTTIFSNTNCVVYAPQKYKYRDDIDFSLHTKTIYRKQFFAIKFQKLSHTNESCIDYGFNYILNFRKFLTNTDLQNLQLVNNHFRNNAECLSKVM